MKTPWLQAYLEKEEKLKRRAHARACVAAFDCLFQCGLRDGDPKAGQFCIDTRLAYALKGDVQRGLFFRGSEPLPFGNAIRTVRELMQLLLGAQAPLPA